MNRKAKEKEIFNYSEQCNVKYCTAKSKIAKVANVIRYNKTVVAVEFVE